MQSSDQCKIHECGKPVTARGWCNKHYRRWVETGSTDARPHHYPATCTAPGCERKYLASGWCSLHWSRMKNHGSLELPPQKPVPFEDRFWPKVDITGFCWLWNAATDKAGYGVVNLGGGKVNRAHRVAYELLVGPIPAGLHLDHLCRVRRCLNPDHLEPVTPRVNMARGFAPMAIAARTLTCKRGHSLQDAYLRPDNGGRQCRACIQIRSRKDWRDSTEQAS